MNQDNRVILLISIMAMIAIIVESSVIAVLYSVSINQTKERLVETAKSQARIIEAIARFNINNRSGLKDTPIKATLSQIRDAHENYKGFGKTGEFTLSRKEGKMMCFLLSHRHYDMDNPKPVPLNSGLAQPMQMALSGKSGTILGYDYRGVKVLAAHEPLSFFNMGIVAKIDIEEIRAPFIRAAIVCSIISLIAIFTGAALFVKITSPIIKKLNETIKGLQEALYKVKTLKGLIPICSSCKKIRDDTGYWNNLESYLEKHSDADFSHGICPECLKKHYKDI